MNLPLAAIFVISFTYTITSIVIRATRRLDERADARRRNQAHPWRK